MANDASIILRIKDKLSSTMNTIRSGALRPFNKDLDELRARMETVRQKEEALVRRQAELKTSLTMAKRDLQNSTLAWKQFGDEVNRAKMADAQLRVERLSAELRDFQHDARNTRAEAGRLQDSLNRIGSRGGSGFQSLASGLAAAGLLKELGTAAAGAADALATSALGARTGTMLSSIVGGAASGAAALAFLGAPAMATGALVGGAAGAVTGATKNFQSDEAVSKDYVQGLYQGTKEEIASGMTSGSTTAGGREQTQIAFAHRFGSEEEAKKYLSRVKQTAVQTNYGYDEITGYSKKLLNTYDTEKVFDVLRDLSDASAGLNLNTSDVDMFISGLSRMRTTGKATQEYLNYFGERGIDVFEALSRSQAIGITKENMPDALSRGDVKGGDAADAILSYIEKEFGGLSAKLESSYDAVKDNLEDAKKNVDEGYGIGYNETRKKGMEYERDTYNGEVGDAVSALNSMIGASQASFDNLAAQMQAEALAALTTGKATTLYDAEAAEKFKELHSQYEKDQAEYATGDDARVRHAGEDAKSLRAQALALATAAYDSTDAVKDRNDTELDLISATRDLTSTFRGGVEFRVKLGGALSVGSLGSSVGVGSTPFSRAAVDGAMPSDKGLTLNFNAAGSGGKYAVGLPRVPYDDFPALLHQGERVLTASAARETDHAGSGNGAVSVQIAGNLVVREEADIERIATALFEKIKLARMGGIYGHV